MLRRSIKSGLLTSCILLQGRSIPAMVLSVLHVLAYYVGDAIIMAWCASPHLIYGSVLSATWPSPLCQHTSADAHAGGGVALLPNPDSVGVLGGIGAFDNAVQGALLGPILLSSIAVFFDLHVRLIAGLPTSASTASLASLSRTRSMSTELL